VIERTIAAQTHGRYLVSLPAGPGPWPLLVGFHGYAEDADLALERLERVDADGTWLRVAVQGLSRFYRRRSHDVIASWMTRQHRDLAIRDNIAYVTSAVAAVAEEWPVSSALVFLGFSQGVAMAFRSAVSSARGVTAVVALAGDIPPEIDQAALSRIPRVLIGQGSRDHWYTDAKREADERRLVEAGVAVERFMFEGGHEWGAAFDERAGDYLHRLPI
jgi:predicted esterase